MASLDSLVWLQERTALGILSPTILEAISAVIKEQIIPVNTCLIEEDTNPVALYIRPLAKIIFKIDLRLS